MKNKENHGVKELYSLVFKRSIQAQSKLERAMRVEVTTDASLVSFALELEKKPKSLCWLNFNENWLRYAS